MLKEKKQKVIEVIDKLEAKIDADTDPYMKEKITELRMVLRQMVNDKFLDEKMKEELLDNFHKGVSKILSETENIDEVLGGE